MSIVSRNIQRNTVSRGLGGYPEGVDPDSPCEEIVIGLEQIVSIEEDTYPITGTFAGVKGWQWNKSLPQNKDSILERIENSIGDHTFSLEEATVLEDWQGASKSGLKLNKIVKKQKYYKKDAWVPEIETGVYSIYNKEKKLFSKSSISKVIENNTVNIEEPWLENSIDINIFKRDLRYNNFPLRSFRYSAASSADYTFNIENETLTLNGPLTFKVGTESTDKDLIICHAEYLGFGKPSRTIIYSKYFPIKETKLYSIRADALYNWTKVDNFSNSTANDYHYMVDEVSGRITFPEKVSTEKLYIKEDLGTSIEFFKPLDGLKKSGFVDIQGSSFEYKSKSKYKLYFEGRQASEARGDFCTLSQKGKYLEEEEIYLSYDVYPRLDVEIVEDNFSSEIDLKPYSKQNSNGILQLDVDEQNINKILLTSDKTQTLNNIYETLYIGSDSATIYAEVLNANGKTVEEAKVTFTAEEGSFEGEGTSIVKVSNSSGIVRTSYFYDYTDKSLSHYSNPRQIGQSSYFEINNLPGGLNADDIYLFQILKTDPIKGSLGEKVNVISNTVNGNLLELKLEKPFTSEDYKTFYEPEYSDGTSKQDINRALNLSTYYNYGLAVVYFDNNLVSKRTIIRSAFEDKLVVDLASLNIELGRYGSVTSVKLFKRNELEFSLEEALETGKSFDRVVYKYDNNDHVYKRLKCSRIVQNRLYYDDIILPEGSRSEDNIVAGYKLFFPQLKRITASALDPASGQIIQSNEIYMKIDFPSYLRGEQGFKFVSEDDIDESALGGSVFLTVNPEINNSLNIFI